MSIFSREFIVDAFGLEKIEDKPLFKEYEKKVKDKIVAGILYVFSRETTGIAMEIYHNNKNYFENKNRSLEEKLSFLISETRKVYSREERPLLNVFLAEDSYDGFIDNKAIENMNNNINVESVNDIPSDNKFLLSDLDEVPSYFRERVEKTFKESSKYSGYMKRAEEMMCNSATWVDNKEEYIPELFPKKGLFTVKDDEQKLKVDENKQIIIAYCLYIEDKITQIFKRPPEGITDDIHRVYKDLQEFLRKEVYYSAVIDRIKNITDIDKIINATLATQLSRSQADLALYWIYKPILKGAFVEKEHVNFVIGRGIKQYINSLLESEHVKSFDDLRKVVQRQEELIPVDVIAQFSINGKSKYNINNDQPLVKSYSYKISFSLPKKAILDYIKELETKYDDIKLLHPRRLPSPSQELYKHFANQEKAIMDCIKHNLHKRTEAWEKKTISKIEKNEYPLLFNELSLHK